MSRKTSFVLFTLSCFALLLVVAVACSAQAVQVSPTASGGADVNAAVQGSTGGQGGGRIAFVSDRGGQVDLWSMDSSGSSLKQVTKDVDKESAPAWSPNGRQLAYTVLRQSGYKLMVVDSSGGTPVKVFESDKPLESVWSTDSAGLFVKSDSYNNVNVPAIYFAAKDGGTVREVLRSEEAPFGGLSAAPGKVAAAVQTADGAGIYFSDGSDRSMDVNVESSGPAISGADPVLSPDGRYISFSAPPMDDDPVLWVKDLQLGSKVAINADSASRRWDHGVTWAPDGKRLAFVRSSVSWLANNGRPEAAVQSGQAELGDEGLRIAAGDGTVVKRLTGNKTDTSPVWSQDGTWLAFMSARGRTAGSDIWVVNISGENPKNLTNGNGSSWSPTWSR